MQARHFQAPGSRVEDLEGLAGKRMRFHQSNSVEGLQCSVSQSAGIEHFLPSSIEPSLTLHRGLATQVRYLSSAHELPNANKHGNVLLKHGENSRQHALGPYLAAIQPAVTSFSLGLISLSTCFKLHQWPVIVRSCASQTLRLKNLTCN